jgi:hypothetical protein
MMADYMIKMPRQWGKYRGGVSKIPQRQQGHALKYVEVISNTAAPKHSNSTGSIEMMHQR